MPCSRTGEADIYNFLIKNKSWPFFQRFKKHTSLDHYKKWRGRKKKTFLNLGKNGRVNQVYIN